MNPAHLTEVSGPKKNREVTSRIWPTVALHSSPEMPSLPGHTHRASTLLPFTFHRGTRRIAHAKKNAINWTFPGHAESSRSNPGWAKEVGRSTRPDSWGHLISVPLPIADHKPGMRQAPGVSPDPETRFKNHRRTSSLLLARPFSHCVAPHDSHGGRWKKPDPQVWLLVLGWFFSFSLFPQNRCSAPAWAFSSRSPRVGLKRLPTCYKSSQVSQAHICR